MTIIEYCAEEVERQGHDTSRLDGIERVGWMLDAWSYALTKNAEKPTVRDLIRIGMRVEPQKNMAGIRTVGVRVRSRLCPHPSKCAAMLADLFDRRDKMKPLDFYRGVLEIHPFVDGNGRSGKVILNWLNGTLERDPVFPPDDFWGRCIRNP